MRGSPRLALCRREPDKAYISDYLWLPKALVHARAVQEALQYYISEGKTMLLERMWDETRDHLIVPREFVHPSNYPQYPFPFIDLRPRWFPRVNFGSKIALRDAAQQAAYAALVQADNGILNLGPGKGKTVLALQRICDLQMPALVVVPNTFLLKQWEERIAQFIEFPLREELGYIQGPRFEWQRPLVIASLTTLAMRARDDKLPPGFYHRFGSVWYDEVHHLGAVLFCVSAPLVAGHRYGLTATDKRVDGLEFVYNYHIGPVFYTDMTPELLPEIFFQLTPIQIDLDNPGVRDVTGQVNISKLRGFLGRDPMSNWFRYMCIKEAFDQGRKILAVSHSKDQILDLAARFPSDQTALIVAETDQDERPQLVKRSRITFAISKLGVEGLDDPAIDVLFFLTPFSNKKQEIAPDLVQALGRIQRGHTGKRQPIVIIFDDLKVPPLHAMARALRKHLAKLGYKFSDLQPPVFT